MNPCKISVIIPNFNDASTLREAVCSVAEQKEAFEVLIIDDASTDESALVMEQLAREYATIRIFRLSKNRGPLHAANVGAGHAKGDYLHFLSANDRHFPNSLEKVTKAIRQAPDAPLISSDWVTFEGTRETYLAEFTVLSAEDVMMRCRTSPFWLPGNTVFIKKTVFDTYGPFDPNLRFISDWYLIHRIALERGVAYLPESISAFRIHPGQYSSPSPGEKKRVWLTLLARMQEEGVLSLFARSTLLRRLGLRAIFTHLLAHPKYWNILLSIVLKRIKGYRSV